MYTLYKLDNFTPFGVMWIELRALDMPGECPAAKLHTLSLHLALGFSVSVEQVVLSNCVAHRVDIGFE